MRDLVLHACGRGLAEDFSHGLDFGLYSRVLRWVRGPRPCGFPRRGPSRRARRRAGTSDARLGIGRARRGLDLVRLRCGGPARWQDGVAASVLSVATAPSGATRLSRARMACRASDPGRGPANDPAGAVPLADARRTGERPVRQGFDPHARLTGPRSSCFDGNDPSRSCHVSLSL